ncbi:MAG TPA: PKD domain-containing protein, partial [Chitinophagaceae bacterium]|nr:PKD domain-containing protein [Chitinophagaceae bacterium]
MRIRGLYTFLLIILSLTAGAGVYYIAPGGNDANAGTISSPWFSLNRAWIGLAPGDTLYIRGGTYNYAEGQRLLSINGTAADSIKVWAFPGEIPVITKSAGYNVNAEHELIYFEGSYFHFKGIEIANFSQDVLGDSAWTAFRSEASFNCVYEQINYHHNVMPFSLRGASTGNLVLNSDFHHNADPFGLYGDGVDPYGGGDGLDLTIADAGTVNTIRGCRAWWNSDDGFDCWSNSGFVTIENCWSWFNGFRPGTFIPAGDGSGYKLGLTVVPTPNILRRIVRNNVSFRNRIYGFNEAGIYGNAQVYNNTSASDGEFGFIFNYSTPDYSGYIYYIRNNISYNNPDYAVNSFAIAQRNSWQDNFNVTAADFQSLDSTQLLNARQTDGSLPDISFLHLAPGSALIDSGMVVGIPYFGSAPDLGAFETNGIAPPANQPPVADAGIDQVIGLPVDTVTLDGSASSDPDGIIDNYLWRKISGPVPGVITSPFQAVTVINGLAQGTYLFELSVTDNSGSIDKDTMQVTVNPAPNVPPVANAGIDQTLTLPTDSTTLDGSTSGDADGTITTYAWNKISGPAAGTITNPSSVTTSVTGLVLGVYQFELTVTDNNGATDKDTMQLTVNPAPNVPPVANAGIDQTLTLPTNNTTLDGSASTDPDGTIATYAWAKISGPVAGTLTNPASVTTTVTALVQGTYLFELTVTDNNGATDKDT